MIDLHEEALNRLIRIIRCVGSKTTEAHRVPYEVKGIIERLYGYVIPPRYSLEYDFMLSEEDIRRLHYTDVLQDDIGRLYVMVEKSYFVIKVATLENTWITRHFNENDELLIVGSACPEKI